MRRLNSDGCARQRRAVDRGNVHLRLLVVGRSGELLLADGLVVPLGNDRRGQLQRDVLRRAVERDLHLVLPAVLALDRDGNHVVAHRQHLHVLGDVARLTDERGDIRAVDDDGGARLDVQADLKDRHADLRAQRRRVEQIDRGERHVDREVDRLERVLIALLRVADERCDGHVHRVLLDRRGEGGGLRVIPHVVRNGDFDLAVRDDVGALHLPQVDRGVLLAVDGQRVRGVPVVGRGVQNDLRVVVLTRLQALIEHELPGDQYAAHTHRRTAEHAHQELDDHRAHAVRAALAEIERLIGVFQRGARLDAAGHVLLVRQRALIAGVRRVAVVIVGRLVIALVIGERPLGARVAKVAVGRVVRLILLRGILHVLLRTALLAAADGCAIALSGGKILRLGLGNDDLRLPDRARHALGLAAHLGDELGALPAAGLELLDLIRQRGVVKRLRVKGRVRRLRLHVAVARIILHHLQGGLFLVHVRFPGLYRLRVAVKRRAAAHALGQIGLIPGAAMGTFHAGENLRKNDKHDSIRGAVRQILLLCADWKGGARCSRLVGGGGGHGPKKEKGKVSRSQE